MTRMTGAAWAMLAIATAGILAGCSGYENPRFGGSGEDEWSIYDERPALEEYVPEPEAPSQQEIDRMAEESLREIREDLGLGTWSCTLSVTYNDDWHDDILCSDGQESHRPYLREWDGFVEEWEILESAAEYEAQLNAGE